MDNQAGFETWMARVDAILDAWCGASSADLPDVCYRDLYDAGVRPGSAAARAYREAGGGDA